MWNSPVEVKKCDASYVDNQGRVTAKSAMWYKNFNLQLQSPEEAEPQLGLPGVASGKRIHLPMQET